MDVVDYGTLQGKEFVGVARNILDLQICMLMYDCFKTSEYQSFESWAKNFRYYLGEGKISPIRGKNLNFMMDELSILFGLSIYESLYYIIQMLKNETWTKYAELVKTYNNLFTNN